MNDQRSFSLADRVFETLEQNILDGVYPPGEILTETALSQQLGVSRTPIREAIRRLQQENMVRSCGKGIQILGIDLQDLSDIYEIRIRIEGLAARWTAQRISEEGLKNLRDTLDLEDFYTLRGDAEHLKAMDTEFHSEIYRNCGSEMLEQMLTDLHRKIGQYRQRSLGELERAKAASAEHRQIFEAIAAKDEDAAERLTTEHVRKAKDNIIEKENL